MLQGGAIPEGQRKSSRKVIVVLPAYNEAQNISGLLSSIDDVLGDDFAYEVIVVDDGSSDETVRIVENRRDIDGLPITLHRHKVNQGLGTTIRDGLQYASQAASDRDVVVTMDADETHTPGLIPRMMGMIREGHDVVIASRYQPGARVYGLSRFRHLMSDGASWLFRTVFPTRGVRDYTCGYRAYRGSVLHKAIATYGDRFVEAEGFQCMVDILLKLREMQVIFGEVPMILRYDLKQGQSKMRVARTVRQVFALMIRRRLGLESRGRPPRAA